MIPWQLKFSGIRDYGPTLMKFDSDHHVIVSGPNGSGKSTITFCIGAALYSAKVDVSGLRPRKLPTSETWQADISLLFKNEGKHRVDAPQFVQFSLSIMQRPNGPVEKEYRISTGHDMKKLEQVAAYQSGESFHNFSQYKKELRFKYKIDPDAFYSIWYQEEMGQFAVMSPEERFHFFGVMYGIDKTERDWELKAEQVQKIQQSLGNVEDELRQERIEMDKMENVLTQYDDHKERLKAAGTLYIRSLHRLERYYEILKGAEGNRVRKLTGMIKDAESDLTTGREKKVRLQQKLERLEGEKQTIFQQIGSVQMQLVGERQAMDRLNDRIARLEKELEPFEPVTGIQTMPEEEVKLLLDESNGQLKQTISEYESEVERFEGYLRQWETMVHRISALTMEMERIETVEREYGKVMVRYGNSHSLKQQLVKLKDAQQTALQSLDDIVQEKQAMRHTQQLIGKGEYLSKRQKQSLDFCRQNGILAFPFQALLQLDKAATVDDERKLGAIKHTIFFSGKQIEPPNDLYHVPLQKVLPDKGSTVLKSLRLEIKEDLKEQHVAYAMKALWWVEQLFSGKNAVIQNGVLIDRHGVRGSEGKDLYILGGKASRRTESRLHTKIAKLSVEEQRLHGEIQKQRQQLNTLSDRLRKVEEAESVMRMPSGRLLQVKELDRLKKRKALNEKERAGLLKRLETIRWRKVEQMANSRHLQKLLEQHNQSEELEKVRQAVAINREKKHKARKKMQAGIHKLEQLEEKQRILMEEIQLCHRNTDEIANILAKAEETCKQLRQEKKTVIDKIDELEKGRIEIMLILADVHRRVPALYEKVRVDRELADSSIATIKHELENAKTQFEYAWHENAMNSATPEDYAELQRNYSIRKEGYDNLKLRLEHNLDRLERLEKLLEMTIDTRVASVRRDFKENMALFQLEGDVVWRRHTDRNGRTSFRLYLQVRKVGHAGPMMDVGGMGTGKKVGARLSGGEESLCSLLFALALLQNLQTSSNFIVLDEFDSALDEERKVQVFDLYTSKLKRKFIILSPRTYEDAYYDKFSRTFILEGSCAIPKNENIASEKVKRAEMGLPSSV